MSGDPFESPKLLVERAIENIADFESQSITFFKNNPWVQGEDLNSKTLEKRCYVRIQERIPGRLRAVASEIVNGLRHSLDQAVCAASSQLGAVKVDKAYFPFSKLKGDLAAQLKFRCKDVPMALRDFLCSFEPYLGGDDVLWALSRIAGPNKHQVMLSVDLKLDSVVFTGGFVKLEGGSSFGFRSWNSVKQELDMGVIMPDPPSFQWTPMLAFRSWRGVSYGTSSSPGFSGVI